jgi:hypothetical protein
MHGFPQRIDIDGQAREAIAEYATLHLDPSDTRGRKLVGVFPVDHNGVRLDSFEVSIDLSPLEHGLLPSVQETGGRIPREGKRHINHDGTACICLPQDYFARNPGRFNIIQFFDGPVRDYFIGQALVERGDPWPFGEWNHDIDGTKQWLESFMRSLRRDQLERCRYLIGLKKLKGHHRCFCGSGQRIRKCHLLLVKYMRGGK